MNTEIKHFHLFCGLGGGAAGFNKGHARVGNYEGEFRCIGGVDNDAAAIRDFAKLSGTAGTVLDMFSRDQYLAFHGKEPGQDWIEATTADIHRAAGNESPNIVFLSAPCKGFSGLLSQKRSLTDKYQALNQLTLRGMWLMLEAFKDDLPELIVFENVPRIASRGRHLLDQINGMLQSYGYAVAETTHDCGELGNLAQSRRRFLLVARQQEKVPAFLYEPIKRPLRAVGDILGRMPLPGAESAGPMHRIPRLHWKTWVRLAFVEAGKDWRSLNSLAVENGHLRDYLIVPKCREGYIGVNHWEEPTGTVCGKSSPTNGKFSVADPRFGQSSKWNDGHAYGVLDWAQAADTIPGQQTPGQGKFSVADPRHYGAPKHNNVYRIIPWEKNSLTVSGPGSGQCVADPRTPDNGFGKYAIVPWDKSSGTVISGSTTGQGAFAVADQRIWPDRENYQTGGHYGVNDWDKHSYAISGSAKCDNGFWSVADPRMPKANENVVAYIQALDNTWHRPFTTLELAALQGLVDPEDHLELDGKNDGVWRERIGNAVPPPAAQAIASMMGETILLARMGETFQLSSTPLWVRGLAVGLSVESNDLSERN